MFGPDYFDFVNVPFLIIPGTHDAMIQSGADVEPVPGLIENGALITI